MKIEGERINPSKRQAGTQAGNAEETGGGQGREREKRAGDEEASWTRNDYGFRYSDDGVGDAVVDMQ